jgi:hypothetical protein
MSRQRKSHYNPRKSYCTSPVRESVNYNEIDSLRDLMKARAILRGQCDSKINAVTKG